MLRRCCAADLGVKKPSGGLEEGMRVVAGARGRGFLCDMIEFVPSILSKSLRGQQGGGRYWREERMWAKLGHRRRVVKAVIVGDDIGACVGAVDTAGPASSSSSGGK